jgi:dTMP kinase
MERTDSGLLIAFEGIDGAGKTTQVGLLEQFFRDAEAPCQRSKEPTDGPWGRKIRASASNGRMSLSDELHALTEDRKEHIAKLISPALARGDAVILDRYFYSTIAYQGTAGGSADRIASQMFDIALTPDVVILIDVPPEIGLLRIQHGRKETPNRFEEMESLRKARAVFRSLADKYPNVLLVDGTQNVESVRREIMHALINGALKKRYCAKSYGCDDPFTCSPRILGTCLWAKMCRHANVTS